MNGGTCTDTYTCNCPTAQWTGSTCETAVCREPCSSHGRCIAPDTCECDPDWTGAQCDTSKATGDGNTGDGDGASPSPHPTDKDDGGLSGGQIAGIVIGVLLGVLAIAALAAGGVWYYRYKRLQREQQEIDYHVLNAQPLDDLSIDT